MKLIDAEKLLEKLGEKKECKKHKDNSHAFLCAISKHEECDRCKCNDAFNQLHDKVTKIVEELEVEMEPLDEDAVKLAFKDFLKDRQFQFFVVCDFSPDGKALPLDEFLAKMVLKRFGRPRVDVEENYGFNNIGKILKLMLDETNAKNKASCTFTLEEVGTLENCNVEIKVIPKTALEGGEK